MNVSYIISIIVLNALSLLIGMIIGKSIVTYEKLSWLLKDKGYKRKYKIKIFIRMFFSSQKCFSCAWYTVYAKECCDLKIGLKCKDYVNEKEGY